MPRERKPEVGRPFNAAVTVTQQNAAYQTAANVNSISVDPPMTIANTPGGGIRLGIMMPRQVRQQAVVSDAVAKQFRLKSAAFSDALRCRTFLNEVEGDDDVWIARPWFLRGGDTWGGVTRLSITYGPGIFGRDATKGEITERQRLIPSYIVGDLIMGIRAETGVIVPGTEEDDEPESVKWIDLNVDARMWSKF